MRVPATPCHGSIGINEENELDPPWTAIDAAVIPISCVVCLGVWVLAIWKVVELVSA